MLQFEIYSTPQPQKQTRFSKGRAYDPSLKVREAIQWQIRPFAPNEPLNCPLMVEMTFYLPIPKGTSKVKVRQMLNNRIPHIKRPDIDNLAYIVTNAMKQIIYHDDSQIVDLILHKRYSETPRTVIKVIPYE
jgi:Holliday junction resolvase RusA-like endonuclease